MSAWGGRLAGAALLLAGTACAPVVGQDYAPGYYEPAPRPVQYWGDNRWEERRWRDDRERRRWEAERNARERDRRRYEERRHQDDRRRHEAEQRRPRGDERPRGGGGGGNLGDRIIEMTR